MLGEPQKVGLTSVWKSCRKKKTFHLSLEGLNKSLPKVLPGSGKKNVRVIGTINNLEKSFPECFMKSKLSHILRSTLHLFLRGTS